MLTLAVLSFLYLHFGYQVGKKGWKVWKKKDSRSMKSLLFFPVSRRGRKVGKGNFLLEGKVGDETFYKVAMTFGWLPILAANLAAIGIVIGPEMLLTRLFAKRPTLAQRNAQFALAERNRDRGLERRFKELEARVAAEKTEEARPPALPEGKPEPVAQTLPPPSTSPATIRRGKRGGSRRRRAEPAEPVTVRVEIDVRDERREAEEARRTETDDVDDPFRRPARRGDTDNIH